MAKATRKVEPLVPSKDEAREKGIEEIEQALAERKDAILELIDLVDRLHESDLLPFISALVNHRDQARSAFFREINRPHNAKFARNVVDFIGFLGTIEFEKMQPFMEKINRGILEADIEEEKDDMISMLQLIKSLKDPEVNRSIRSILAFLRGMGKEE
ncbi:DUF1641 domain-containing protein [Pseudalkalibacillus salsuginis]|uniref:DUF1641 domain-containing protein n=1 Tax=Pseudalkalibacillus salsuginis TaxID=2910972 RepID=UPI001F2422B7|nr:DUF1641 domain-containing protein [Pseudalkalibacillus salsuginis]MCF6410247.1 DUF1641 domain-containing protein [Pseudalkalibacillus salsuginis]